jgi:threonine dehydratase/serine racemase
MDQPKAGERFMPGDPAAAAGRRGGSSAAPPGLPDGEAIRAAAARIAGIAHRTPVVTSRSLDEMAGARLYFKCENLQRAGAFKLRGAANTVLSLAESEARRGVVTHSSGNHGAALALAAAERGVPCWVVMPHDAPAVKRAAVAGYGAEIVYCEPTLESREAAAARLLADTGATLVHPFDDPRVIAGQGTATLELLAEVPGLDRLVVPVGGGGLAAGTAIAAAGAGGRPPRVTAAEPEAVDDAARSLATGVRQPPVVPARTVADGLRTCLAERTFRALVDHRVEVVTVSEAAIVAALRTVFERLKLVIEPSAAVAVAAVLGGGAARPGERVGIILSGGNVDPERLAQLFSAASPPG